MSSVKLSEEEGQSLIENYLKTQEVKFIKYELIPISDVFEGYMGEHYNLRVTYLQNGKAFSIEFFIKHTPTINKFQVDLASRSNIYAREIFLYDFLFKEFKNFGFDTRFAGESYYCIPNKAIIMENLTIKGYRTIERSTKFNLEQLKCALKSLAAYHGEGFGYQKTKSLQLGKNYKLSDDFDNFLLESFFIQYIQNVKTPGSKEFWLGCHKTLHTLVDLLPKDDLYKKKFRNSITNFKLGKIFSEKTNYAKTLGHGDLWSNNILFKMDEDKLVACCLVDYQNLRYFYPSFDVMLIIYSNTDREFRNKYFQELYDYYYDTLTEIYHNYGFHLNDILPKQDYKKTLEISKIDMLFRVISVSAITCIPKEILNEKGKSGDDFKEAFFNNHKICAQAFQNDEYFRNTLSELLTDLYNSLEVESN